MDNLIIIYEFLKNNNIQILSTSIDNTPISRPVASALLYDKKIFYCMNKDKKMYEQLKINSKICICTYANDFTWIRINANVVFSNDLKIKQEYINQGKTRFKSANDNNFIVFYLQNIKAEIHKKSEIIKLTS